ncbi:MAG: CHAT domain-containing protein, partial [Coleofasciculaceae cyanobacterium SM2_1_6]|nr:CHAT domain-containing protein [Coleofasciculaceae cyanobacterium SM2_1_6]
LNKAQFLQLLQAHHQALQFTGHGCHDPETPENSYLNLGEDQLLLTDLLRHQQLDLSSYRLICLTACESGITTQSLLDEYIGWGSAFLAQQARTVISTLWNVDVRSSAFLIIRFYQLFSNPEKPISAPQALREAQSWLSMLDYEGLADWYTELARLTTIPQYRDYLHTEAAKLQADPEKINGMERPFTDPYHWAGFICTGLNQ